MKPWTKERKENQQRRLNKESQRIKRNNIRFQFEKFNGKKKVNRLKNKLARIARRINWSND